MTITLAPPTTTPDVVRVQPAPRWEPPFDDELAGADQGGTQPWPQLPLDWRGERRGDSQPEPGKGGGLPRPTPAELAAVRLVNVCREILGGYRPVRHLSVLVAPECLDAVSTQLTRPRRRRTAGPGTAGRGAVAGRSTGQPARPGTRPGTGASGEPVPGRRGPLLRSDPVVVRHQRVTQPLDGVAEVSAVLGRGDEVWAMALRLEQRPGGWLCTYLQVL
jgi:hypothetical protein